MLMLCVDVHWELKALQFDLCVEVFKVYACIEVNKPVLGLFGVFLFYHGEVVLRKCAIAGFVEVGSYCT